MIDLIEHMNLGPTPKALAIKIIQALKQKFAFELNSPVYLVIKPKKVLFIQY